MNSSAGKCLVIAECWRGRGLEVCRVCVMGGLEFVWGRKFLRDSVSGLQTHAQSCSSSRICLLLIRSCFWSDPERRGLRSSTHWKRLSGFEHVFILSVISSGPVWMYTIFQRPVQLERKVSLALYFKLNHYKGLTIICPQKMLTTTNCTLKTIIILVIIA